MANNYLDPKYWVEPDDYSLDKEDVEQIYASFAEQNTPPKDIPDLEARKEYIDYLAKNNIVIKG